MTLPAAAARKTAPTKSSSELAALVTPAELKAEAAVLMDAHSGRVLWSHNMRERLYPASMTKVMTALVYAEQKLQGEAGTFALDAPVAFSKLASEVRDSPIGFVTGESLRTSDLLYLLLLRSDNKAAHALAEQAAGSVANFAELMNAKAREVGARETHFVNPHGLHDPAHYTTARDMALIARAALRNPLVAEIAQTRSHLLVRTAVPAKLRLDNRNKLLWRRADATGLKTGYTRPAGRCFIGTAERGDLQLIAVVMKSPDIWGETSALLDYGFAHFASSTVARRDEVVARVQVENGQRECPAAPVQDVIVAVTPEERHRVQRSIHPLASRAPVHRGQKVGRLTVSLDTTPLTETDLVAAEEVEEKPTLARLIATQQSKIVVGGVILFSLMFYGTLAKSARASRRRLAAKS